MSTTDLNISSQSFLTINFERKFFESDARLTFIGRDNVTDREVFVDLIKESDTAGEEIQKAVKNLTWLAHPNILEYKSSFQIEPPDHLGLDSDSCCIVVQQLFEGASTLEVYLRTLPSNDLKKEILVQVLKGLDYLHSNQLFHGNLQPQNILIKHEEGNIKIKLKGFALPVFSSDPIEYLPPEYFRRQQGSVSGDIWSFGAILFEMIMGQPPFGSVNSLGAEKLKNNILSGLHGQIAADLSPKVRYLIDQCLQVDPQNRLKSVKDAYDILLGNAEVPSQFIEQNLVSEETSNVILSDTKPRAEPINETPKTEFDNNELVESIFVEDEQEVQLSQLDEENDLIEKINSAVQPSSRKESWREKSSDSTDTALNWTWSVLWIVIGLFAITFFSISVINHKNSKAEATKDAGDLEVIASQSPQPASNSEVSNETTSQLTDMVTGEVAEKKNPKPNESIKIPPETPIEVRDDKRIQFTAANGKIGLKDGKGNITMPPRYQYIGQFDGGLAMVKKENKWGFINSDGKEQIPASYDFVTNFTDGLAAVRLNGKWGFISTAGNVLGEIEYDYVKSFSQNTAAVSKDGLWGYIDRSGKLIIPFKFDSAEPFSGDKAKVSVLGIAQIINLQGNCIEGCQ
ncbi:MAG: protein kinase [Chitinophagales bacterium]|nr:protein kinase [Chitinophagales bacterium]